MGQPVKKKSSPVSNENFAIGICAKNKFAKNIAGKHGKTHNDFWDFFTLWYLDNDSGSDPIFNDVQKNRLPGSRFVLNIFLNYAQARLQYKTDNKAAGHSFETFMGSNSTRYFETKAASSYSNLDNMRLVFFSTPVRDIKNLKGQTSEEADLYSYKNVSNSINSSVNRSVNSLINNSTSNSVNNSVNDIHNNRVKHNDSLADVVFRKNVNFSYNSSSKYNSLFMPSTISQIAEMRANTSQRQASIKNDADVYSTTLSQEDKDSSRRSNDDFIGKTEIAADKKALLNGTSREESNQAGNQESFIVNVTPGLANKGDRTILRNHSSIFNTNNTTNTINATNMTNMTNMTRITGLCNLWSEYLMQKNVDLYKVITNNSAISQLSNLNRFFGGISNSAANFITGEDTYAGTYNEIRPVYMSLPSHSEQQTYQNMYQYINKGSEFLSKQNRHAHTSKSNSNHSVYNNIYDGSAAVFLGDTPTSGGRAHLQPTNMKPMLPAIVQNLLLKKFNMAGVFGTVNRSNLLINLLFGKGAVLPKHTGFFGLPYPGIKGQTSDIGLKNFAREKVISSQGRVEAIYDYQEVYGSNPQRLELQKSNFQNTNVYNTNAHNTNAHNTNAHNTNAHNTNAHNTNLRNTNVHSTNDHNVSVNNANGHNTNIHNVNENNSNVHNTNVHGMNIDSTNIQGTNLHSTNIHNTNIQNTNMQNTNTHSINIKNSNFKAADSVVTSPTDLILQGAGFPNLIDSHDTTNMPDATLSRAKTGLEARRPEVKEGTSTQTATPPVLEDITNLNANMDIARAVWTNLFDIPSRANSWAFSMLEKNIEFYRYYSHNHAGYEALIGSSKASDIANYPVNPFGSNVRTVYPGQVYFELLSRASHGINDLVRGSAEKNTAMGNIGRHSIRPNQSLKDGFKERTTASKTQEEMLFQNRSQSRIVSPYMPESMQENVPVSMQKNIPENIQRNARGAGGHNTFSRLAAIIMYYNKRNNNSALTNNALTNSILLNNLFTNSILVNRALAGSAFTNNTLANNTLTNRLLAGKNATILTAKIVTQNVTQRAGNIMPRSSEYNSFSNENALPGSIRLYHSDLYNLQAVISNNEASQKSTTYNNEVEMATSKEMPSVSYIRPAVYNTIKSLIFNSSKPTLFNRVDHSGHNTMIKSNRNTLSQNITNKNASSSIIYKLYGKMKKQIGVNYPVTAAPGTINANYNKYQFAVLQRSERTGEIGNPVRALYTGLKGGMPLVGRGTSSALSTSSDESSQILNKSMSNGAVITEFTNSIMLNGNAERDSSPVGRGRGSTYSYNGRPTDMVMLKRPERYEANKAMDIGSLPPMEMQETVVNTVVKTQSTNNRMDQDLKGKNVEAVFENMMSSNLNRFVDRIYSQFEKRLKLEKVRRGI